MSPRTLAALPAANADAPYHDVFSALRALTEPFAWHTWHWQHLVDAIEADGRPIEAMTVGELLAHVAAVPAHLAQVTP